MTPSRPIFELAALLPARRCHALQDWHCPSRGAPVPARRALHARGHALGPLRLGRGTTQTGPAAQSVGPSFQALSMFGKTTARHRVRG